MPRLRQSADVAALSIFDASEAVEEAAKHVTDLVKRIGDNGFEIGITKVDAEDFISRYRLFIKIK